MCMTHFWCCECYSPWPSGLRILCKLARSLIPEWIIWYDRFEWSLPGLKENFLTLAGAGAVTARRRRCPYRGPVFPNKCHQTETNRHRCHAFVTTARRTCSCCPFVSLKPNVKPGSLSRILLVCWGMSSFAKFLPIYIFTLMDELKLCRSTRV